MAVLSAFLLVLLAVPPVRAQRPVPDWAGRSILAGVSEELEDHPAQEGVPSIWRGMLHQGTRRLLWGKARLLFRVGEPEIVVEFAGADGRTAFAVWKTPFVDVLDVEREITWSSARSPRSRFVILGRTESGEFRLATMSLSPDDGFAVTPEFTLVPPLETQARERWTRANRAFGAYWVFSPREDAVKRLEVVENEKGASRASVTGVWKFAPSDRGLFATINAFESGLVVMSRGGSATDVPSYVLDPGAGPEDRRVREIWGPPPVRAVSRISTHVVGGQSFVRIRAIRAVEIQAFASTAEGKLEARSAPLVAGETSSPVDLELSAPLREGERVELRDSEGARYPLEIAPTRFRVFSALAPRSDEESRVVFRGVGLGPEVRVEALGPGEESRTLEAKVLDPSRIEVVLPEVEGSPGRIVVTRIRFRSPDGAEATLKIRITKT
ncbi:MAG: hypothetical protein R3F20_08915 [Planctomycetota bacterium]